MRKHLSPGQGRAAGGGGGACGGDDLDHLGRSRRRPELRFVRADGAGPQQPVERRARSSARYGIDAAAGGRGGARRSRERDARRRTAWGWPARRRSVIARARDALAAAARHGGDHGLSASPIWAISSRPRRATSAPATPRCRVGWRATARRARSSRAARPPSPSSTRAGRGGRNMEYLLGLAIALDGAAGHLRARLRHRRDRRDRGCGRRDRHARHAGARRGAGAGPGRRTCARTTPICSFDALGDLVVTGPTLTNVNDFRAILIVPGVTIMAERRGPSLAIPGC